LLRSVGAAKPANRNVEIADSFKWENYHRDCITPIDGRNSGPSSPRYAYSVVYAPRSRKILVHGGSNINVFSHRVGVLAHLYQYVITDTKSKTHLCTIEHCLYSLKLVSMKNCAIRFGCAAALPLRQHQLRLDGTNCFRAK
jgi:hypothetical protein